MSKKSVKTMTSPRPHESAALVLASSSSYRRALLERLGLPFSVVAPKIDEAVRHGELPAATRMGNPSSSVRAGTITNLPPTPKNPANRPTTIPTLLTFSQQVRGNRSAQMLRS